MKIMKIMNENLNKNCNQNHFEDDIKIKTELFKY